jgi:hypothetical protein
MAIASKIIDSFWAHNSKPSDDLRTSRLFNVTLEETVIADSLAEDDIHCRNSRYSGLSLRTAAALSVYDYMMIVVLVVVVKVVEQFEFGGSRGQGSSDGIYLLQ